MLDAMGLKSLDELIDQTVPSAIRAPEGKGFEHRGKTIVGLDSESGVIRKMTQLAGILLRSGLLSFDYPSRRQEERT